MHQVTGRGALFDLNRGTLRAALTAKGRTALMRAHLDNDLEEVAPYCVPCRDWRDVPIPTRGRERIFARMREVAHRHHVPERGTIDQRGIAANQCDTHSRS